LFSRIEIPSAIRFLEPANSLAALIVLAFSDDILTNIPAAEVAEERYWLGPIWDTDGAAQLPKNRDESTRAQEKENCIPRDTASPCIQPSKKITIERWNPFLRLALSPPLMPLH
jgi:hypothetical protein